MRAASARWRDGFRLSFAHRFVIFSVALVALSVSAINAIHYYGSVDRLVENESSRLSARLTRVNDRIADRIDTLGRDVSYLAQSPEVRNLANAITSHDPTAEGAAALNGARDGVADIFNRFLVQYPYYFQTRFIGVADNGREVVRLAREGGVVSRTPDIELQQKGDREYVARPLTLNEGELYFSEINLNREHGVISRPLVSVVRIATPIFDASGTLAGVVVVNMDMNAVLNSLAGDPGASRQLFIARERGDFIVHPRNDLEFGYELGSEFDLGAQFGAEFGSFETWRADAPSGRVQFGGETHLLHALPGEYGEASFVNRYVLIGAVPMTALLSDIRALRFDAVIATIVLTLLAVSAALVASLIVIKPLRSLTGAARRIAREGASARIDLPTDRRDEFGELARGFERMIDTVRDREHNLSIINARTESILDCAPIGIITCDARGGVKSVNASGAALLGYDEAEIEGRHLLEFVSFDDPEINILGFEQFFAHPPPDSEKSSLNVKAMRSDGTSFPGGLQVARVRADASRLYTVLLSDLSEQRRIDRMKSEFVSTVSHELRTPLTSIKGSLGLMRATAQNKADDRTRSMIEIAYSNADRLVRLINDILDIEKIEAGKLSFQFQKTEMASFLTRAIEDNRAFAHERGVEFNLVQPTEEFWAETDPDRMAQVMANLLSNAAKFTPEGDAVTIWAEKRGANIRISVKDSGPGVSYEFRKQIFSKFAQADSSDTRKLGGTGLGLNISKAIVKAHHGTIDFESTPGEGATFYFEIPLLEEETNKPDAERSEGVVARILICEDDLDAANLLSLIISEMGYETVICASAAEAKAAIAKENFAAMTLDLSMPNQCGLTLIRELRAEERTSDLPIIVVSSDAEIGRTELGPQAVSVVDWLEKPIDINRLRNGVSNALAKSNSDVIRILHVEDDDDHIAIVSSLAGEAGFIDVAKSCVEAEAFLTAHDYDLVILDLGLPDGRGEELLPMIRRSSSVPPQVLVFSIEDLDVPYWPKVDSALVKSRTTNNALSDKIRALLSRSVYRRDITIADA